MDTRREQIIDIINREFIGPDPIQKPSMIQENGEEILSSDPPRIRYAAGILFPQKVTIDSNTANEDSEAVENDTPDLRGVEGEIKNGGAKEFLSDSEELINLSNAYQQSAISMTAAVANGDKVKVSIRMSGRQQAYADRGVQTENDFAASLEEYATIEKPAKVEGRNIIMILAPKVAKK